MLAEIQPVAATITAAAIANLIVLVTRRPDVHIRCALQAQCL